MAQMKVVKADKKGLFNLNFNWHIKNMQDRQLGLMCITLANVFEQVKIPGLDSTKVTDWAERLLKKLTISVDASDLEKIEEALTGDRSPLTPIAERRLKEYFKTIEKE